MAGGARLSMQQTNTAMATGSQRPPWGLGGSAAACSRRAQHSHGHRLAAASMAHAATAESFATIRPDLPRPARLTAPQ